MFHNQLFGGLIMKRKYEKSGLKNRIKQILGFKINRDDKLTLIQAEIKKNGG